MKTTFTYIIILIIVSLSLIFLIFFHTQNLSKSPESYICENCNVVLISVDTLRADFLGSYGNDKQVPNLDNFSREGIVFQNAFSQASWTLPSHLSFFTSLYESELVPLNLSLHPNITTLPEILKNNGYRTASFNGGVYISSDYGFDRGFDYFSQNNWNGFDKTVPLAIDWINKNKNSKFFVFLHGYDLHEPYGKYEMFNGSYTSDYSGILKNVKLNASIVDPFIYNNTYCTAGSFPEEYVEYNLVLTNFDSECAKLNGTVIPLTSDDVEYIKNKYFENLLHADYWLGQFLSQIKTMGLENNTVIIILSDHGEDFMEHGLLGHYFVYYTTLKVPLFIKSPTVKNPVKITSQVRLLDVAPTILDFLNITQVKNFEGRSLVPLVIGRENESIPVISEYLYYNVISVIDGNWHFIYNVTSNTGNLYNIDKDPEENNDVYLQNHDVAMSLLNKILATEIGSNDILKKRLNDLRDRAYAT
jgi:arylsulfatase A-like enzyme